MTMPDTFDPALEAALLPCPFCGKIDCLWFKPYRADDDGGEPFDWGFNVQCNASGIDSDPRRGCGAFGSWGETKEEAIAAWNTRASPQAEIDRLRDALDELERVRPGAFWLLGKGRTSEKEPLFGFQVLFGTDDVLADGEGETAADAIRAAVSRLHPETPKGGENA